MLVDVAVAVWVSVLVTDGLAEAEEVTDELGDTVDIAEDVTETDTDGVAEGD